MRRIGIQMPQQPNQTACTDYTYIYIYTHTYVYMYVCVYIYIYIYIYIWPISVLRFWISEGLIRA